VLIDDFAAGGVPFLFQINKNGSAVFVVNQTGGVRITTGLDVGFSSNPVDDQVRVGDANFNLNFNAGTPQILFDSTDLLKFDRATNIFSFLSAAASLLDVGPTATVVYNDLLVQSGINVGSTSLATPVITGTILMTEIAEPSNAAANQGVFFLKDSGAGKTQACVRFASGATQVFATEP
jgi:hypothetical protein